MKATIVFAFTQEKALVGAFFVIVKALRTFVSSSSSQLVLTITHYVVSASHDLWASERRCFFMSSWRFCLGPERAWRGNESMPTSEGFISYISDYRHGCIQNTLITITIILNFNVSTNKFIVG